MQNLKAKLKKQGGFTLIEMLIVVAIIAILIAIAIPLVNKALEKAREATDQANERAAMGLAYVDIMADPEHSVLMASGNTNHVGYYVVSNNRGDIVADKTDAVAYGKGTAAGDITDENVGKIIEVTYYTKDDSTAGAKAGDVVAKWVAVS